MNNRKIVFWITAICLNRAVWAVEAPGARSPIGSPAQVPSAHRTGAIASQPNLYGYAGNLTMSGNIGGGRHFRGFVPYSSMEYLDPRLIDRGSLAVSSFARRSAGYEPYYDPGRTVASLRGAGVSGLSSPGISPPGRSASTSTQWLSSFDITELLRPPDQRPLTASARSVEAVLDQQIARDFLKREPLPAVPVQTALPGVDPSLLPAVPQIPVPPEMIQQTLDRRVPTEESKDVTIYQRLRQELLRSFETDSSVETPEGTADPRQEPPAQPDPKRSSLVIRPKDVIDPAAGRAALKNYPDFRSLAAAKAAEYMTVGEQFLKQGQYYKAADAFELALVWDSGNTLLVLARSHALFAAGEYMSSAYYLSQALQKEPKLADCLIDWGFLMDTRDAFENRLTELSTWQQRSNSAELAFLMGYVLYMDGKLTRARISAEYAVDMMPDNPAARILQEAIEKALNPTPAGAGAGGNP